MKKKKLQNHIKEFYRILEEIDTVAYNIYSDHLDKEEVTEEWVASIAPTYTDMKMDSMEIMALSAKLWELYERRKERAADPA